MPRTIRLLDSAERDIDEIVVWYDQQRAGVGLEFLNELHDLIASLEKRPGIQRVISPGYRRGLMRRFPYLLVYRFDDTEFVVIAVFHNRRGSKVLRSRIRGDEASENDGEIEPPRAT
jgi:plasmid stabilization system protein ParE